MGRKSRRQRSRPCKHEGRRITAESIGGGKRLETLECKICNMALASRTVARREDAGEVWDAYYEVW